MKKTLLALAVLSAITSTVSAQSSVVIYGIADGGLVHERGGAAGSVNKLTSGVQSGSRLGIRGKEDLGRGLSAVFTLETGIAIDTGGFNQGNLAFGRQSFVGLESRTFGSVTLGRQYTVPYLIVRDISDPFAVGFAGTALNLIPVAGSRMNNTLKYTSLDISGFSGEIAYGFGEVPDNSDASRAISGAVGYANGPVKVRLGYHNVRNAADTGSARNTLLGASWDFNVAKAHLGFGVNKGLGSSPYPVDPSGLLTTPAASPYGLPVGPGSDDTRDLLVGVTIPFGQTSILASYIRKDDRSGLNNDAHQWALGLTYSLSKRTNFYTSYARISNDNTAAYTVGNGSENGSGDKGFNLGLRHSF
ncbi:MAG: porin [Pseudomonadota bacterium]